MSDVFKWCTCQKPKREKIYKAYFCNRCNNFIEPKSMEVRKSLAETFTSDKEYIMGENNDQ